MRPTDQQLREWLTSEYDPGALADRILGYANGGVLRDRLVAEYERWVAAHSHEPGPANDNDGEA